jgi:ubiquinone/menaquinone biosynthesis C-methylase UbiE
VISDPEDLELSTLRALADFTGQRVIEIGAGDGRLAWPLAPEAALWVALEPDGDEVAAAHGDLAEASARSVRLVRGDARALPLPAGAFDVALFTWSLC